MHVTNGQQTAASSEPAPHEEVRARLGESVFRLPAGTRIQPLDGGTTHRTYLLESPGRSRFQMGKPLAELLQLVDGRRTLQEICDSLSERLATPVDPERVGDVLEGLVVQRGVLERVEPGIEPEGGAQRAPAPAKRFRDDLSLNPFNLRMPLFSERVIAPFARAGSILFHPLAFVLGWVFIVAVYWSFLVHYRELGAGILANRLHGYDYAAGYGLAVFSVLLHELGHAAAARRYGASTGTIGIGLYVIFPSFFADVSDVWRLKARQRVVVDIGGFYFQLLTGTLYLWAYQRSGNRAFLWGVFSIMAMISFSLNPLFKFDGYWLLSDALGIPNLRKRASDALRYYISALLRPREERKPRPALLVMGHVRYAFFFLYALVSQAILLLILYFVIRFFPVVVLQYPEFAWGRLREIRTALGEGETAVAVERSFALLFRTLFFVGLLLMLRGMLTNFARGAMQRLRRLREKGPLAIWRAWRAREEQAARAAPRAAAGTYSHLALLGALASFPALYGSVLIHEAGHALAGLLIGGELCAMRCVPWGKSVTYVLFEPGAASLGQVFYYSAGVLSAGALGFLGMLRLRRIADPSVRLLIALTCGTLQLTTLAYLVGSCIGPTGDVERVLRYVHFHHAVLLAFFLVCLVLVLLYVGRELLEALARFAPLDSIGRRLLALGSFLALPGLALIAWLADPRAEPASFATAAAGIVALTLLWSTLLDTRSKAPAAITHRGWGLGVSALTFSLFALEVVFSGGTARWFVDRPPEYAVQAVNVRATLQPDGELSADFLMQPFSEADSLLWERARGVAPRSYAAYERFALEALDSWAPGWSFALERSDFSADEPFFRARQSLGARIVTARGTRGPEVSVNPDGTLLLELRDFWRLRGSGYIDRLRLDLPAGHSIAEVTVDPPEAGVRVHSLSTLLVITNPDAAGPSSVKVVIQGPPPRVSKL